jgi:glycine cleavage system T protein
MSEAAEQITAKRSPLHETHLRLGATMKEQDGWLVPASYGDDLFEYAAVREKGAGLIDLSPRARFHISGSEAERFLNGLITNDVKTLAENQWMPAAFPNVQGRLLASVRVGRLKDGLLIDTEAVTGQKVFQTIQRFTLAGDFHVTELTEQTALLSIQGKQAVEIVNSVLSESATQIPEAGLVQHKWQQHELTVWRAGHTADDGFDLVARTDDAQALWEALIGKGARPIGYGAFDILRIEASVPLYGVDVDETTVVPEALEDAVSYTKGCYIGQEIIARIKYRGHVAKKLIGVDFDRPVEVEQQAKLKSVDDKEIGRLTSTAFSPHLGRTIALGYVKHDYAAPGIDVKVSSSAGDLPARVAELPFVRGSG